MTTNLPTVTRVTLKNGKYRFAAGPKVLKQQTSHAYAFASVFTRTSLYPGEAELGRAVGDQIIYLHARRDLAEKNNNAHGCARVGVVEVVTE